MGEPALRDDGALAGAAPPPVPRLPRPIGARIGRRVILARQLMAEIEGLQPVLQELVQQYELRMTAQLAEILRTLNGEAGRLPRFPAARTSAAMLRALRTTDLKPRKGRAKDLVRLQELVAELTEMLPPGD
jgi:hypothetical protein